jgi:hypothetical protein
VRRLVRSLFIATATLTSTAAMAAPSLLAVGTLTGSAAGADTDLSGLTAPLENGLPGNILGGIGSALAWAGGNTFLAAPDRGPNATPYNSAVDDTVSYIARFQTVTMALTPSGGSLPFTLTPTLTATTLLSSPTSLNYGTGAGLGNKIDGTTPIGAGAPPQNTANKFYFTGRSDNFGAGNSGNANNARLDPEGMRVSADGKSIFVSDEYGPYVYQFDRATGSRIRSYTLPGNLDVANLSPVGNNEMAPFNTSGRVANKGMEGLAITPDGKTLVGIMQAATIQDAAIPATGKLLRIVTIDVASGTTHEYGYLLTTGSGVSEITAINDHEFLVDERDGNGLGAGNNATNKRLYKIDLTAATDITGLTSTAAAAAAVGKTEIVDLVALLGANGITRSNVPAKIEGIAFGDDIIVNGNVEHTLWIANDNDFVSASSGPNTFYVVGLTDADLGSTFVAQSVPEPTSLAVLAIGLIGCVSMRRWKAHRGQMSWQMSPTCSGPSEGQPHRVPRRHYHVRAVGGDRDG